MNRIEDEPIRFYLEHEAQIREWAALEKERCPAFPRRSGWWPAYANVDPPVGRFREGDNLREYRERLVETLLNAWRDLAPLVDEAVSRSVDP